MEKQAPRYSILLPAFRARFLKVCLESILRQTESDFELIVVDDASPEDLESIVRSFPDPRIRYFRNAVGCGAEHLVDNWNICLGYARGEFVLNMGDDDLLEPRCLEAFGELIARHPDKDVFHMRASFIDANGTVFRVLEERPETESLEEMVRARWKGRPQMIGDYLFRRQPLVDAGGYYDLPYAWCSDDISVFRAAREKGIANSNEPLFHQWKRPEYGRETTGDLPIGGLVPQRVRAPAQLPGTGVLPAAATVFPVLRRIPSPVLVVPQPDSIRTQRNRHPVRRRQKNHSPPVSFICARFSNR